jgi:hypothetical protein
MTETVLIVRHGPGRGRLQGYCDHVLGWIKRERPETYARIRLHETGSGAVSMEGVSGVFCWLADPLTRYPECLEEALVIESEARGPGPAVPGHRLCANARTAPGDLGGEPVSLPPEREAEPDEEEARRRPEGRPGLRGVRGLHRSAAASLTGGEE